MAESWFYSTLALIIPVGVVVGWFDAFLKDSIKQKIAGFMLRASEVSFSAFESAILTSTIRLFMKKEGVLSWFRIAVFTVSLSTLGLISSFFFFKGEMTLEENFTMGLLPLVLAYLSFPSDCFSIWLTKKLFYEKSRNPFMTALFIFIDMVITTLFVVASLFAIQWFLNYIALRTLRYYPEGTNPEEILFGGAYYAPLIILMGSTILSLAISFIQVTAISLGVAFRILLGPIFGSGRFVIALSKINEKPLTTLIAFLTILVFLAKGILLLIDMVMQEGFLL